MWAEACAMIERAEHLHRQFFQPAISTVPQVNWEPPVDIFDTGGELWIIAALPGVEPKDLSVSIDSNVLVVAGLRPLPEAMRGAAIHRLELPHGRFERRILLPNARFEVARSKLVNGCLYLSLIRRP
jgi:HSP20 family protein